MSGPILLLVTLFVLSLANTKSGNKVVFVLMASMLFSSAFANAGNKLGVGVFTCSFDGFLHHDTPKDEPGPLSIEVERTGSNYVIFETYNGNAMEPREIKDSNVSEGPRATRYRFIDVESITKQDLKIYETMLNVAAGMPDWGISETGNEVVNAYNGKVGARVGGPRQLKTDYLLSDGDSLFLLYKEFFTERGVVSAKYVCRKD